MVADTDNDADHPSKQRLAGIVVVDNVVAAFAAAAAAAFVVDAEGDSDDDGNKNTGEVMRGGVGLVWLAVAAAVVAGAVDGGAPGAVIAIRTSRWRAGASSPPPVKQFFV